MKTEITLTLEHFSEGVKATFHGKHCSSLERLKFVSACYEVLDEIVEKTLDMTKAPKEIRGMLTDVIKNGLFGELAGKFKGELKDD